MSQIFVSYKSEERARVEPLVRAIEAHGWSVWWDSALVGGDRYRRVISAELDKAQCVLVIWSSRSVESDWVMDEATSGHRRGILVAARFDRADPPLGFGQIHVSDLSNWKEGVPHPEFDALVAGIAGKLGRPAMPARKVPDAQNRQSGAISVNPMDGLEYVWIAPGKFVMGASDDDREAWGHERGAHEVEIAAGFWITRTPITVGAWKKYMRSGGPDLPQQDWFDRKINESAGDDALPVVMATWEEAKDYCRWAGTGLPSEAQWEYAARAGNRAPRYGELDEIGWYANNSGGGPRPVGQLRANAWGLYDTLGNVWEWTADGFAPYGRRGSGHEGESEYRVSRGGSWLGYARFARVSCREAAGPRNRLNDLGFRCVADLA